MEQNVWLIPGSIKDNILFTNSDTNDESDQINKVIMQSGLDKLVANNGLDTPIIKENINGISGGEAKRISLARALLSKKSILIVDEPTTGLDQSIQNEIFNTLLSLKNITLIVVTHNLDHLDKFDKIITLK